MESNFDNKDFEQFVKQNADQYRMFPSEKVWKGIYSTLHTRRKWYSIGLITLLLTTGIATWIMLNTPKPQFISPKQALQNSLEKSNPKISGDDVVSGNQHSQSPITNYGGWRKSLGPLSIIPNQTILSRNLRSNYQQPISPVITPNIPYYLGVSFYQPNDITTTGTITDDSPEFFAIKNKTGVNTEVFSKIGDLFPQTIESVVNFYSLPATKKRWAWQIYFAPTISYRKLSENKTFLSSSQSTSNSFNLAAVYDVNNIVTHKPDMGFELGFNAGYRLTESLKITSGLQFNVSRYDIRAYNSPTELVTVALNNGSGLRSSISTATNYRNLGGYSSNWLHNLYLSASLPIGAELKILGDGKNYFGIGGTLQPTYIVGDRAYLISTDYKNYVEIPQLIRRWNLSTGFEAFLGYSTGKINWKVGPQVRYQLLSSFQKKYPVKEQIFDFGLKVGVMLNQ